MTKNNVAIIVPTLGTRDHFFRESLKSIRAAGNVHIVVVAPLSFANNQALIDFSVDQFVIDPGRGLVSAINQAFIELPCEIDYVNWLGDDDLLAPSSISKSKAVLENDINISFTYGQCRYIDGEGKTIGTNRSGKWASKLIFFGPDLIPQPGALIRREVLSKVGFLDDSFTHAFDMDMFIKLLKVGKGYYINSYLSSFRWHTESLSVKTRKKSVSEASRIRRNHFPKVIRQFSLLWELPLGFLVLIAGIVVTFKSKEKKK